MRIECDFPVFKSAVEWGVRSLDPRGPLNATGLRFQVFSEDLKKMVVSGVSADAAYTSIIEVESDGEVDRVLQGPLLAEIVKAAKADTIVLESDTSDGEQGVVRPVNVACGRAKFVIPVLSASAYPPLPELPPVVGEVDGAALNDAVKRVAPTASLDNTSLTPFTGVQLTVNPKASTITLAATDRYRFAVNTIPYTPNAEREEEEPFTLLVPAKTLTAQARAFAGETMVWSSGGEESVGTYGIRAGDRALTGRLLAGAFPAWERLLPDPEALTTKVVFNASDLLESLKRVALVVQPGQPVRLSFEGDEATFTAGSDGASAVDTAPCTYSGDKFEAAYNVNYLLGALQASGDNTVVFLASAPTQKAVIASYTDNQIDYSFWYMVMPTR